MARKRRSDEDVSAPRCLCPVTSEAASAQRLSCAAPLPRCPLPMTATDCLPAPMLRSAPPLRRTKWATDPALSSCSCLRRCWWYLTGAGQPIWGSVLVIQDVPHVQLLDNSIVRCCCTKQRTINGCCAGSPTIRKISWRGQMSSTG